MKTRYQTTHALPDLGFETVVRAGPEHLRFERAQALAAYGPGELCTRDVVDGSNYGWFRWRKLFGLKPVGGVYLLTYHFEHTPRSEM